MWPIDKRIMARGAAFAAAGLATTVVVAAAGSLLMTPQGARILQGPQYGDGWGYANAVYTIRRLEGAMEDSLDGRAEVDAMFERSRLIQRVDPEHQWYGPTCRMGPFPPVWRFVEAGWPMPAFRGWAFNDYRGSRDREFIYGLVKAPMLRGDEWDWEVDVPFVPVAGGLGFDTAAFGTAWWLVLAGPWSARRAWRRRRGRCVACGYEMKELERCPECGGVVRASGLQSDGAARPH